MKPGDLVIVTDPCQGNRRPYKKGEIGLITGLSMAEEGHIRDSVYVVQFHDGSEDFAYHLIEVISEDR
jgi:hypothetical protein